MAKRIVRHYPGYAVDPIFRIPPSPNDANLGRTPRSYVNNPGSPIALTANANINSTPTTPGALVNFPRFVADELFIFQNLAYVYNCIEVDATYPAAPRGYTIPDQIAIYIEKTYNTSEAPIITNRPDPVFIGQVPNAFGPYQSDPNVFDLMDYVCNPSKTAVTPIVGDYTNSSQMYDTKVFRLYGVKNFSFFWMNSWGVNNRSVHPGTPTGCLPQYNIRVWYDPDATVLRVM